MSQNGLAIITASLAAMISTMSSTDNIQGSVICAGLSCLDLPLLGCTKSGTSASMTGTTLALLLRSSNKEVSGDVNEEVHILTKIGPDFAGDTLLEFYRRAGASTRLVLKDETVRTSMAVLPVFKNGKRACFVDLAYNDGFQVDELLGQLDDSTIRHPRAFLFGYPHLMPKMQGDALRGMLAKVRQKLYNNGERSLIIGVDLNGVDGSDRDAARSALIPALDQIDVLHLNEDEAAVLTSTSSSDEDEVISDYGISKQLMSQIELFHDKGCAVVLLSLGSKGAFVSVTPHAERLKQLSSVHQPYAAMKDWTLGTKICVPAYKNDHGEVNANGAGDALFSGFCSKLLDSL